MGLSPSRILERLAVKLLFGAAVLFLEFEILVRCVKSVRSFAKIGTGIVLEPRLITVIKTASIVVILGAIGLGLVISTIRVLRLNPRKAEPLGPQAQQLSLRSEKTW
jgi:hypothetical protein